MTFNKKAQNQKKIECFTLSNKINKNSRNTWSIRKKFSK